MGECKGDVLLFAEGGHLVFTSETGAYEIPVYK